MWRYVVASVAFGLIGYVVGMSMHLQLNARLTGSYLENFLGNCPILRLTGAVSGGVVGAALPWLAYRARHCR